METAAIYYAVGSALSSEELLKTAAAHFSGKSEFVIHRERGKKPYFVNHPKLHFSVSHSGDLWVCAFAPNEIGCDIQIHREIPRYKKLSERWFHPNEAAKVMYERDFYETWSRKEAFVKAIGYGIDEKFKKFDTTSGIAELDGITLRLSDFKLPCDDLPCDNHCEYSSAIAYHCAISPEFVCLDTIL